MSLSFYLFAGLIGLLLLLFAWSQRKPLGTGKTLRGGQIPDEFGRQHATHLPQIRRALSKADYDFLTEITPGKVLRRVRRERQDIAICYLRALREDFHELLRMAKVIATLSPEVKAVEEFERFYLTVRFAWRFETIRFKLTVGMVPLAQVDRLANAVSGLSVRIEQAVRELGERAALASELASALNRGGIDTV